MENTTLQDVLDKIPPEAWPLIDQTIMVMMICVGVWMLVNIFIYLRRRASNLTPVHAARKNKKATPDFLKINKKARKNALKQGENFEKELLHKEKGEARAAVLAGRVKPTLLQRILNIITFLMSFFTLATMIYGAIFNVTRMGKMLEEYSTIERLESVVQAHPIAVTIASLVIIFHIIRFVTHRKWKES